MKYTIKRKISSSAFGSIIWNSG